MEILQEMVRNIVVIVLITTFLDMLLPSSNMQRFVKVIMGLFILVSLLNPVIYLLDKNEEFEVLAWQYQGAEVDENILTKSKELETVNDMLLHENYVKRLERQIEALVKLVEGVKEATIKVTLKTGSKNEQTESIEHVYVEVLCKDEEREESLVEPVKIDIKGTQAEEKKLYDTKLVDDIKKVICQYFSCNFQDIEVVFL